MESWKKPLLKLNRRQVRTLMVGIGVVFFLGLFPPWNHVYVNEVGGKRIQPAGYGSLLSPPQSSVPYNWYGTYVDVKLLFIHWIIAVGITAALIFIMRDKNKEAHTPMGHYRVR